MKFDPEKSPINLIDRTLFLNVSALLEFMIAVFALFLGSIIDVPPLESIQWNSMALIWGVLSFLPLMLYFVFSTKTNYKPLADIREFLVTQFGPILAQCRWSELFILSLIIGFSEELLFRGVIQVWLTPHGIFLAIVLSNICFAMVHSLSRAYVIVVFFIGLYLGGSLYLTEERNLLVPIISHALYDFVAFLMIKKMYLEREPTEIPEELTS